LLTETEAEGLAAALESVLRRLLAAAHVEACRADPRGGGVVSVKHLDLAVRKPTSFRPTDARFPEAATEPSALGSATAGDAGLAALFPHGCSAVAGAAARQPQTTPSRDPVGQGFLPAAAPWSSDVVGGVHSPALQKTFDDDLALDSSSNSSSSGSGGGASPLTASALAGHDTAAAVGLGPESR
jgi:hypothetical protein